MHWAEALLKVAGYRLVGQVPEVSHVMIIFAPHTSNWDFPLLLLVRSAFRHKVHYLAKHTLFRWPFGWFFRMTGGIPVDRSQSHDLVARIAQIFVERKTFWLAISPEGTREKTDHWKSGFYRIALEAKVPVLCAFIDAGTRRCGVAELIHLSGDTERDLAEIRAFYADKQGIRPELAGEIRFS